MKYVVFYGGPMAAGQNASAGTPSNEETMAKAQQHYPAHRARVDQFIADKRILMIGAFDDPMINGSMSVFPTRQDAEAFIKDDPFVLNGVVRAWRLLEWNEIAMP